jgi:hypothetical protein
MKKILFFVAIGILIISCSESKEVEKRKIKVENIFLQQVNLNLEEIHCWLNTMPGGGAKFNISGKADLLPSTKYDFATTKLKNISVVQNGEQVYLINPTIRILQKNDIAKEIAFSTIRGLGLVPQLNPEKPVTVKLIFADGSDKFAYEIDNVKIEKIY